jgi:hypothetical protein
LLEREGDGFAEGGFVVHHEDVADGQIGGRRGGRGSGGRLTGGREVNVKRRAGAGRGVDREGAAVLMDDGVGDREAEAHAFLHAAAFGRKVGVENFRDDVEGDAVAGVGEREVQVFAGRERGDGGRGEDEIFRAEAHDAAGGHGFAGVEHEIVQDAFDLGGVDLGPPEVGRDGDSERTLEPLRASVTAWSRSGARSVGRRTAASPWAKVMSCCVSIFAAAAAVFTASR